MAGRLTHLVLIAINVKIQEEANTPMQKYFEEVSFNQYFTAIYSETQID